VDCSPNACSGTVKTLIETVSRARVPVASPDSYFKEIGWSVACKDDEFVVSNNGVLALQLEQPVVANQRSEEPVSSITLKDWDLSTGKATQKHDL
jgi:hypothetical protein